MLTIFFSHVKIIIHQKHKADNNLLRQFFCVLVCLGIIIMRDEIIVKIGKQEKKCILGNGFYSSTVPTPNLHKHNYAEIHVVAKGDICLRYDTQRIDIQSGSVFLIPENKLHVFERYTEGLVHTAFLIESKNNDFKCLSLPPQLLECFFNEIEACEKHGDYAKISAYISIICCDLFPESRLSSQRVTDHAFLINNFFSMNYTKDVSLSDLAAELHFSEKQTERLVLSHTGTTFKKAMVAYRMSIADHLAETTDLSFAEIAEKVGYNSYNGFRKAYSKYCGK